MEYGSPVRCLIPSEQKELEEKNRDKGAFYREECAFQCREVLDLEEQKCMDIPVDKKAEMLLANYPIVPAGVEQKHGCFIKIADGGFEEIIEIHNHLVEEFNNWVAIFINSDLESNRNKYLYIEPFDFTQYKKFGQ